MLRFNGTAEITPTLSLQGFYMYRAPMKIEGGQFSKMQFTNFTLRKKIDGEKASVSLRVQDPFKHEQVPRAGGDVDAHADHGAEPRRPRRVPDLPVQLRPAAARPSAAAGPAAAEWGRVRGVKLVVVACWLVG